MKDLDKMTKEELKEMIKELEEKKEKVEEENETLDIVETKEKIERLLDGATCIICCTDKGILNMGYSIDIMNLLTNISKALKRKMPKDMIKFAVENGLCDDEASALKHLMDELIDRLGE